MKSKPVLIGIVVALVAFAVVVYSLEQERSLWKLGLGFILFILPVTFISSVRNAFAVFFLVLFTAFFAYGMYHYEYYDTLLGMLLALVIGGSIAFFRIRDYKLFSPAKYKQEAANNREPK